MEEFTYCKYACSFVSLFSYICASLSIYFKVISVIYIISYNINAFDNLASLCVTEPFSAMTYYPTEFAKRIRPRCFSIGSAGRHDSGSIQQMDAILKWMTLERDDHRIWVPWFYDFGFHQVKYYTLLPLAAGSIQ